MSIAATLEFMTSFARLARVNLYLLGGKGFSACSRYNNYFDLRVVIQFLYADFDFTPGHKIQGIPYIGTG